MQINTHIINRVFFEINTNNKKVAIDLKDNLSVYLQQDIFPFIEKYLSSLEFQLVSEIVQIPRMNIELNIKSNNYTEEIKQLIKTQVVAQLQKTIKSPSSTNSKVIFISKQEEVLKSFFYFLEEGVLPWNTANNKKIFNKKSLHNIVKASSFNRIFNQKIIEPAIQNRLINQFETDDIKQILQYGFNKQVVVNELYTSRFFNEMQKLNSSNQRVIWLLLIKYLQDNNLEDFENELEKGELSSKMENNQVKKTINILLSSIKHIHNNHSIKADLSKSIEEDSYNIFSKLSKNTEDFENELEKGELSSKMENNQVKKTINILLSSIKHIHNNHSIKADLSKSIEEDSHNIFSKLSKNTEDLKKNKIEKYFNNQDQSIQEDIINENLEIRNLKKLNPFDKTVSKVKQKDDNKLKNKSKTLLFSQERQNETKQNFKEKSLKTKTKKEENILESNNEEVIYNNDKADYYVVNAGLILLHPFLRQFFNACGLLNKKDEIIDKELAVHLLHYVATKKEKQLESNLIFEKFICGVPIKQSIKRNRTISKNQKEQVTNLLQSVIDNWKILKNSSIELVRNEFLQRPGKLSLKGDNPKIIIERKTQDILIDKIPWNINMTKIPWLDKIIFVDW